MNTHRIGLHGRSYVTPQIVSVAGGNFGYSCMHALSILDPRPHPCRLIPVINVVFLVRMHVHS